MKKFIKRVLVVAIIAVFISGAKNAKAGTMIYERKERNNIASGVSHVKVERFTQSGWVNINILKLDAGNEFSKLVPLIPSSGVSTKSSLTSMMNSTDAVAGVNGDFFETIKYSMPLGTLYGNGKLHLSAPETEYGRNAFIQSNQGINIGVIENLFSVTNSSTASTFRITAINKLSRPYTGIAMLNSSWGAKSPGASLGKNVVEVLVQNGAVVEKRQNGEPFALTDNSYVLVQIGENLLSMNPGDALNLSITGYDNLKFSIGGGNVLLKDGEIPSNSKLSGTRAPRTAIAVNRDNTEILLVTVDGRSNQSIGMSEVEFANYLKEIGAHRALNLDGGGSTTMGIKYSGNSETTVVNAPSESGQRSIANGVGISSTAPRGEINYLKLTPKKKAIHLGDSLEFEINAYDIYHNKIEMDRSAISYEVVGGTVSGNTFTGNVPGTATINAYYGNATGSFTAEVRSELKELELGVSGLQLNNGESYTFKYIDAIDAKGYRRNINTGAVEYQVIGNIGYFEGNKFIAGNTPAKGAINVTFYGLNKSIPVAVGSERVNVYDFSVLDNVTWANIPNDEMQITSNVITMDENVDGNKSTALYYSVLKGEKSKTIDLNFTEKISLGNSNLIGMSILGDSSGAKIKATISDDGGEEKTITMVAGIDFSEWKYVEANVPTSLSGNKYLKKISVVVENKDAEYIGKINFDNLVSGIALQIDPSLALPSTFVIDPQNYNPGDYSARISLLPLPKVGDKTAHINHLNNASVAVPYSGVNNSIFANITSGEKIDGSSKYNVWSYYNTVFVTLETNNTGLRSANPRQWAKFIDTMTNRNEKNYVIIAHNNPADMKDAKERTLFYEILENASKVGKNIFLVTDGASDKVELFNGFKRVILNTYNGNKSLDIYLKDGVLSYEFVNIN